MSAYRNPIDASHYAECAGLLLKFRQNHTRRLIATIVLLVFNCYFQTIVYAQKYPSESMQAVIYANNGKAVDLTTGVLSLLYIGAAVGIGVILFKKGVEKKILILYSVANIVLMAGFSVYQQIRAAMQSQEAAAGPGVTHLAFGYEVLTIFLSIACVVLAFFGEQKRPRVFLALVAVTLLATIAQCYNIVIGILLLLMYGIALPELSKMKWVMEQPGYPYFNERFDEAQLHSEYEPMYKLDNRSYGEMEDLDGNAPKQADYAAQEQAHKEQERRISTPQMDYTMKLSDNPAEMPGIDDIFEHVEPTPDPEPPKAEEIPDPKWDVPDTKWDAPEPNWDVPDINADIPDLPEIPDIPKL